MKEMFDQVIKNFFKAFEGKKQLTLQECVVPKSDENEFCQNENNQGKPVQLPCGE